MMVTNMDDLAGYKLVDNGSEWEFYFKYGIFKGNFKQVLTYAVINHGFSIKELERGVNAMQKEIANVANYGIMKTFLFVEDLQKGVAS